MTDEEHQSAHSGAACVHCGCLVATGDQTDDGKNRGDNDAGSSREHTDECGSPDRQIWDRAAALNWTMAP